MKWFKTFIISFFISTLIFAQSGQEYRRSAVHNANLVRTVFGNWGVVGQPSGKGPRGAWLYDTNGYIGDISPLVGAEVSYYDEVLDSMITFHSVVVCPVERPHTDEGAEESPTGKRWTFEPVGGYINANQASIAMSTNPASWPLRWPDKMNDGEDPGWPGAWNGYFGKNVFSADQESYYVMDDNNDEEYNHRRYTANRLYTGFPGYEFKPDAGDLSRNGLGLEVKVRGMQWQQFLAADVIFWLYEVTNTSTTDYSKVAFGMVCGTYLGVTGTDDSPGEYDDDWSFFDVENDITYTGDFDNNCRRNPKWQGPVGMVGYAFLESPGNPYDGIDNDGDNSTDVYPHLSFTAPKFSESDFDTVFYNIGDYVVSIDNDYNRHLIQITQDTQVVQTRGASITVVAGRGLVEGNVIDEYYNVNENAYDGIDNDLDGLIDENYTIHYRQIRMDKIPQEGGGTLNVILFDELRPVCYKDYINGIGLDDPMIDERRDDGIDNDGDWNAEYDDVGADGKDNTNDYGEGDGLPTPGEPNFDATDVDESDQIGLSSFNYFTPSNAYPEKNDETLWEWLKPGYFDVPTTIQDGRPVAGEDGDFIYGSAYFPLRAGETQRFSLALAYGHDLNDLYKNRLTVQKIYDSDYRFPSPPDKPTLTAVAGDGKVTLYWDREAEKSIDPVTKEMDFEGYKIYKATDPDFNEIFSVTNANGVVTGYVPLAQYDLNNTISGLFEPNSELFQEADGYTVNLGSNTGLQHSYVDEDVINGKQYYYAVVAYDRGDQASDIYPSENTKFISIQPDGTVITDINTAVVRPQPAVAGYDPLNENKLLVHDQGPASGRISYAVLDESKLSGHSYRVTFMDTRNDSLDNNDNDTLDLEDPQEFTPVTTWYTVMDLTGHTQTLEIDTAFHFLDKRHIIASSLLIAESDYPDDYISLSEFVLDEERGRIKLAADATMNPGSYILNYQYYPVYQSPNILGSPYAAETLDSDIFNGIQLVFENHWSIEKDNVNTVWNTGSSRSMDFTMRAIESSFGDKVLTGIPDPANYELRFTDSTAVGYITPDILISNVYSSLPAFLRPKPVKTNFYLYNTTEGMVVPFIFSGGIKNSADIYELSNGAMLSTFFYLPGDTDSLNAVYSWVINFRSLASVRPRFRNGDILTIATKKPYRYGDVYEFTTEKATVDSEIAEGSLDNIQVVPNPYIVANNMEAPLPPAVTSGRGERRIEFRKLPSDAKVYIFTSAGALVRTLNHSGDIHNGTLAWDLKSSENLDVAFGVYFYVVESSVGKKSGKVGVIK